MNKQILVLVGQLSSGKGTVAKYIEKKYGACSYRFSAMLRDLLKRLYQPESRENMQNISTAIRQSFGEDIIAKVIAKDVENDEHEIIVVDGARRITDIIYLKKLPGFKLIRIVVSPKIRYKRLIDRNENPGDKNKSYQQFLIDEQREADAEIPKVMAEAELGINNDGNLDDLYKQIDKIVINLK